MTQTRLLEDLVELYRLDAQGIWPALSKGGTPPGPIEIPGAAGWWQETTARYDYVHDPVHCPICGSGGIPWHGWFHCQGTCHAIAVVADGRTFVPITKARQPRQEPPDA